MFVCVCVHLCGLHVSEPVRTEVFCRKLSPLSSVHHELYYHASSFPECRQKEALPSLLLCSAPDQPSSPSAVPSTPNWTDAIDINSPGMQVQQHHDAS